MQGAWAALGPYPAAPLRRGMERGGNPMGRLFAVAPVQDVGFKATMVTLAQLVELRIVVPAVVGSSPIGHPSPRWSGFHAQPSCGGRSAERQQPCLPGNLKPLPWLLSRAMQGHWLGDCPVRAVRAVSGCVGEKPRAEAPRRVVGRGFRVRWREATGLASLCGRSGLQV